MGSFLGLKPNTHTTLRTCVHAQLYFSQFKFLSNKKNKSQKDGASHVSSSISFLENKNMQSMTFQTIFPGPREGTG